MIKVYIRVSRNQYHQYSQRSENSAFWLPNDNNNNNNMYYVYNDKNYNNDNNVVWIRAKYIIMLTTQRLYKTRVWVFLEHDLKSIDCSSTAFDVAVFLSGHRRYLKTKQHVAFKTLRPRSYKYVHTRKRAHTLKNIVWCACALRKNHGP